MTRFFVSPEELGSDNIQLAGENASHAKVLRLKAGEQVLLMKPMTYMNHISDIIIKFSSNRCLISHPKSFFKKSPIEPL